MCEDYSDESVLLRQESATYDRFDGDGHLYVLSRAAIEAADLGIIPLCERIEADATCRFTKQSAWMIGAMQGSLPEECVLAHVEVPSAVLADVAANEGLSGVPDVFPPRSEDPLLRIFLSVPWQGILVDKGLHVFVRGLALPEYDYKFVKHPDPREAFYRPFWMADERDKFPPGLKKQ